MTLLVPDASELKMLEILTNRVASANLTLHLYSNDKTPAAADVLANYTEVTGGGYASKTLTGATWNAPGTTSGVGYIDYPEQTFSFSGIITAYGYFIKFGALLLWAERFPAGPYTTSGGDSIKLTPKLSLQSP